MDELAMREASELTGLTYTKAFRDDAHERKAVFRSLVQKLPDQLDELLPDYEKDLHPSQSVNVMEDKTGVTLNDQDSWMVRCHINSATPPDLDLQFSKRGWTKQSVTTVTLILECRGKNVYVWASKSEDVLAERLAEFILRNLFRQGIQVVENEMS